MIITLSHVRQARMCMYGTREFFRRHKLDFRKFIKHGIDEEELKKTNDAMALRVIEVAHANEQ